MNKKLLILISSILLLNPTLLPAMEKEIDYDTSEEERTISSLRDLATQCIVENAAELYHFYDKYLLSEELEKLSIECAVPLVYKLEQSYIDEHKNEIIHLITHKKLAPPLLHALASRLPNTKTFPKNPKTNLSILSKRTRKELLKHLDELPMYQRKLIFDDSPDNYKRWVLVVGLMSQGPVDIPTAKTFVSHFYEAKINTSFQEMFHNYFPEQILQHNHDALIRAFVDENSSLLNHFKNLQQIALVHFVGMKFVELQIKYKFITLHSFSDNKLLKMDAKCFKKQLKLFVRLYHKELTSLLETSLHKHFEKKYNEIMASLNIDTTEFRFFERYATLQEALENFVEQNISNRLQD